MTAPSRTVYCLGNIRSASWGNVFIKDLVAGFQELGLNAVHAVLGKTSDPRNSPAATEDSFFVDLNGKLLIHQPRFVMVVDNPLAHPHLAQMGSSAALGMIDQGHAEITGYSKAPAFFVPHGGPVWDPSSLEHDRDIDVLFLGHLAEAFEPIDELGRIIAHSAQKVSLTCADPMHQLFADLSAAGVQLDTLSYETAAHFLSIALNEAQRLSRLAALTSIRNCALHVIGEIPADLQPHLPHGTVIHGGIHFDQCLPLIQRSKIIVNVSQKFPRGSHERIWYGMASGCAVITNRSTFVEQDFTHGRNIMFYDDPRQIGDLVDEVLSKGQSQALAEAAAPIYAANHTWTERAERILVAMSQSVFR